MHAAWLRLLSYQTCGLGRRRGRVPEQQAAAGVASGRPAPGRRASLRQDGHLGQGRPLVQMSQASALHAAAQSAQKRGAVPPLQGPARLQTAQRPQVSTTPPCQTGTQGARPPRRALTLQDATHPPQSRPHRSPCLSLLPPFSASRHQSRHLHWALHRLQNPLRHWPCASDRPHCEWGAWSGRRRRHRPHLPQTAA